MSHTNCALTPRDLDAKMGNLFKFYIFNAGYGGYAKPLSIVNMLIELLRKRLWIRYHAHVLVTITNQWATKGFQLQSGSSLASSLGSSHLPISRYAHVEHQS